MPEHLNRKTVNNDGVEIEYYVSNQRNDKATLVISMGIWEPAFRAFPLTTRLQDRHCIVLSYRGRGGSGTPKTGFDWRHHASDLERVLENEPVNNPVFLGFSKGVSYMLGYLSLNRGKAKGVIIVDLPAIHVKPGEGYADFWKDRLYNGIRLGDHITAAALEGIERESTYAEFYEDLGAMKCPIWVFRGTDPESVVPSNLDEEDMLKYKASVKDLEIVEFDRSGHMIFDEELSKACKQISLALDRVDSGLL